MYLVDQPISKTRLKEIAAESLGSLVKAVVDVEKGIMALGAGLHSDEEAFLIEQGSSQQNLWGINLYPDETGDAFIEFDSMINIRPNQDNPDRGVCDPQLRAKIITIVDHLVSPA